MTSGADVFPRRPAAHVGRLHTRSLRLLLLLLLAAVAALVRQNGFFLLPHLVAGSSVTNVHGTADASSDVVYRNVHTRSACTPTTDGAGVRLHRCVGPDQTAPPAAGGGGQGSGQRRAGRGPLDPLLLLDVYNATNPADFAAGFPAHPHRGFLEIRYVTGGACIQHTDGCGSTGLTCPGAAQGLFTGRGVAHEEKIVAVPLAAVAASDCRRLPHTDDQTGDEMPGGGQAAPDAAAAAAAVAAGEPHSFQGFQLWINVPEALRGLPPRYLSRPAPWVPLDEASSSGEAATVVGLVAARDDAPDGSVPPSPGAAAGGPCGVRVVAGVYNGTVPGALFAGLQDQLLRRTRAVGPRGGGGKAAPAPAPAPAAAAPAAFLVLDVTLCPGRPWSLPTHRHTHLTVYVMAGCLAVGDDVLDALEAADGQNGATDEEVVPQHATAGMFVVTGPGDVFLGMACPGGAADGPSVRFLLATGDRVAEATVVAGGFVAASQAALDQAFSDLAEGKSSHC